MHLKIKIIRCILAFPPKVESYLWLFFVFLLTISIVRILVALVFSVMLVCLVRCGDFTT